MELNSHLKKVNIKHKVFKNYNDFTIYLPDMIVENQ